MPTFTDRTLKALTLNPGQKDRLVFDSDCPGLGVRVTAKGTKAFIVQWTDPATRRKVREPLGVWGSITIEQARKAARARLGDVAKGIDPAAERRKRRIEADAEKAERALTLDTLVEQWAELHLIHRSARYRSEAPRAIRYAFADYLAKPAVRLTKADAVKVLDGIIRQGKTDMARITSIYARACYSWAEKRGRVPANPFARLPLAMQAQERDRVLDDGELWELWAGVALLPEPFRAYFRFALLTLQRREEVAGLRWSEVSPDLSTWTIPAARMKNSRPHDVHLSSAARDVLRSLVRHEGSDFAFTTSGHRPISSYSRAKLLLDRILAQGRAGQFRPWRLHDFRRSGVSRLAAMGFDSIIVDKILAHKPARLRGVASVYQRHDFAAERRKALEAWAAHVTGAEKGGNVVQLRAG